MHVIPHGWEIACSTWRVRLVFSTLPTKRCAAERNNPSEVTLVPILRLGLDRSRSYGILPWQLSLSGDHRLRQVLRLATDDQRIRKPCQCHGWAAASEVILILQVSTRRRPGTGTPPQRLSLRPRSERIPAFAVNLKPEAARSRRSSSSRSRGRLARARARRTRIRNGPGDPPGPAAAAAEAAAAANVTPPLACQCTSPTVTPRSGDPGRH
jgi:hypothetical protein